jgi:hypothetical protein
MARFQITNRVMITRGKIVHVYFTDIATGATNLHRELKDGEGRLAMDDWTDADCCAALADVLQMPVAEVEMEPMPEPESVEDEAPVVGDVEEE